MHATIASAPLDPAVALARSAAQLALETLRDDLAVARRRVVAAGDAMPSTTLDWLGPASLLLRGTLETLRADVGVVDADLDAALALVDQALA